MRATAAPLHAVQDGAEGIMKQAVWLLMIGAMAVASAAQAADAEPRDDVTDEQVAALIVQLGDRDPQARDAAEEKLLAIGEGALELLERASKLGDPEIRTRAESLARRLKVPRIPGGPLRIIRGARTTAHSLREIGNTIEFYEDGRHIVVAQGAGSIEVTVAQTLNGKTERQTYRAADSEQLRREMPHVHEVYERAVELAREFQVGRNAGGFIFDRARLPLPQPLDALTNLVEDRMERKGVAEAQRQQVRRLIERTKLMSPMGAVVAGPQNEEELAAFFSQSDLLREKLVELGLPDGEDALPPRRAARLGVQLQQGDLTVSTVAPNERGSRMGLRQGDVIEKLNGKQVSSVTELREALAEAKGPIVIEAMREGKPLVLKEAEAVAN